MPLFHVQDCDRPMYVVAMNYTKAEGKWETKIREENDMKPDEELEPPMGMSYICGDEDLIL